MPLYARAVIPETWLLDVVGRAIEMHRDPTPDGYRTVFIIRGDEPLSPAAFPDLVVTRDQLMA